MQFYKKDGDGFTEVGEEDFKQIFKERLDRIKVQQEADVRKEIEQKFRDEFTPKLTEELTTKLTGTITQKLEGDFKTKIEEATKKSAELETKIRQKTIAAEYGFKSDLESFLGEGDEDDMRAKADVLKTTAGNVTTKPPEKKTPTGSQALGIVSRVA